LPAEKNQFPLADVAGKPLNHLANLAAVYEGLAELLGEKTEPLAARVEENFLRIFGGF
jgi:Tat protein secretion system quality control protein TatD with DNase activity